MGRLGIQSQPQRDQPEHFRRLDGQQIDLGRHGPAAAKPRGEDLQQERFAAAAGPQEEPQAAMFLDEEVQPGQGLLMGRALVETLRIRVVAKRRFL